LPFAPLPELRYIFPMSQKLILVTGATGYVGGRLIPRLLERGYAVRVLVRDPARLEGRPWLGQVQVAQADATRRETLLPALQGVWAAYYLSHGRQGAKDSGREMSAARNFASAAEEAGVERILYLGELVDTKAASPLTCALATKPATFSGRERSR